MGLPYRHAERGLVAVMVFLDHGAERGLVAVMVFLYHGIMGQNMGEVAASWEQNVGA
jgi:hypothetical protein